MNDGTRISQMNDGTRISQMNDGTRILRITTISNGTLIPRIWVSLEHSESKRAISKIRVPC